MNKPAQVVVLIALTFFAVNGLVVVSDYMGYASFSGAAGNIYQLVITHRLPVTNWAGLYGVGIRVDGYNFQQSQAFVGGDIENSNLLFNCLEPDIEHEIYASTH